jgi:hypothetical protein
MIPAELESSTTAERKRGGSEEQMGSFCLPRRSFRNLGDCAEMGQVVVAVVAVVVVVLGGSNRDKRQLGMMARLCGPLPPGRSAWWRQKL